MDITKERMETRVGRLTKKNRIRLITSLLLVLAGAATVALCRTNPAFADWYASGPFQFFPNVIGRVTGILPFSVYEFVIYGLVLLGGWLIWRGMVNLKRRERPKNIQGNLCAAILFVALVFCIASFTILGNYGRSPIAGYLGIEIQKSSVKDLKELCEVLIDDIEAVMDQVERDEEGTFVLGAVDVPEEARKAMYNLGEKYEAFEGYYPRPKPVLLSERMSYLNLTGMYSPFTIEANYNDACMDYVIPYTACHELGHLRGFIREDEAGFVAWLACYHSKEPAFRYSGALNALKYGLNALYREVEYEEYKEFYNAMPLEIRWDLWKNSEYWQAHRGFTYTVGTKVNDTYLKVNAQQGGTKSYGRMIDLLMAYREIGRDVI